MLKKILVIIGLLASSIANVYAVQLYLGPGFSYLSNKTNPDNATRYQALLPHFTVGIDNDEIAPMNTPNLYLALEVTAAPFTPFTIHDSSTTSASLKQKWSYGLSLLPGIKGDVITKFYARTGFVRTRFKYRDVIDTGFLLGAGVDYKLTKYWSIRIDYIYTNYYTMQDLPSPRQNEGAINILYRLV